MYALKEILTALFSVRIWWSIAVDDVIGRYRRTILGPAWLIIAQIAWIAGIYLLHSRVLGSQADDYLAYLAAGLAVWALINGITSDAPVALVRAKGYIESYPLPIAVHLIRSIAGTFVTFAHLLVVYFGVMAFQMQPPTLTMLAVLPGLVIVAVFGLGVELFLAPLGARFRDIGPAVGSAMNLLFILTPIFWHPTPQQAMSPILRLNPFFHLLEIVRGPLMGNWSTPEHWILASASALLALVAGSIVYIRMRATIVYWL
jgi:lipopolysaccharide transport system permease protein